MSQVTVKIQKYKSNKSTKYVKIQKNKSNSPQLFLPTWFEFNW